MLRAEFRTAFDRIDRQVAGWMHKYGIILLRFALGVIFIWYGGLKVFGMSPAADLVAKTVYWVPPEFFIPFLGWWEVLIGICMIFRPLIRLSILLLFIQLPGTMLPLVLLPDVVFTQPPIGLTLVGQYIMKNIVLISAAIVVGGTVRNRDRCDNT